MGLLHKVSVLNYISVEVFFSSINRKINALWDKVWKIRKGAITGEVRESEVDPAFMEYGRVGLREQSLLFRDNLGAKRGETPL